MKQTQQEIIELAREHATRYTNRHYPEKPVFTFTQDALQEFAALLLERFGAGGGVPVGWAVYWGFPPMRKHSIHFERATSEAVASEIKSQTEIRPCYTHPSPTDLRDEYLRGLKEGFKEGWIECSKWAQRDDLIADIGSPSYEACVSAVKALKGKQ